MAAGRQRNDGLRKLCDCPRRSWPKCAHTWHFNFKWNGETYRFSLERSVRRIVKDAAGKWQRDRATLGDRITSKTDAERERDRLRDQIREGTLQQTDHQKPQREMLTLAQLLDAYGRQYLAVHRAKGLQTTLRYQIGVILRTPIERLDGAARPFGEWLVSDITTDTIEAYRRARLPAGATGTNRDLEILRALFNWATSRQRKLAAENPFLDGTKAAIKLTQETARTRRLQPDEGERLLAACGSHLRALVEAAIETGCRRGELLTLQWWQVRFEPRAEIFLPAVKTKTKRDRTVPISTRLRAILDMRRNGPDATPLPSDAYVFGNEAGEPVESVDRAWARAVLQAHGHTPTYTRTKGLTPASRAQLQVIDLHFHDLRREAGSRWLDAGVPLHRIQKWLGHANISQTSTYLMADSTDDDRAMQRFEAERARLQRIATDSEKGAQTGANGGTMGDTDSRFFSETPH